MNERGLSDSSKHEIKSKLLMLWMPDYREDNAVLIIFDKTFIEVEGLLVLNEGKLL